MRIEVNFTTEIPNDIALVASYEQVLEWLTFNLESGSLDGENPLNNLDMKVELFSVDYEEK